jgi:4'-phosphopantetheinyl transferase
MPVATKPFLTIEDVDVWFDALQADEAEYRQYWRWLSESEQQSAYRFVRDPPRRFLVS